MSLKQKGLNLLMFILVFALSEGNQNHSKIGFDHNFYYGSEGESAEICLVIERYVQRITGVITTADGTARRGVDYINTVLAILINSSEPVCYTINLPDDDDSEVLETFTVVFKTNDTNVQILRSNATVIITDDDDIDECVDNGTHNCNTTIATCVNTDGSFRCIFNGSFTENGYTCRDINECTAGTHNCYNNDTCSNTEGSFYCTCNSGYTGNGTHCEDINECTAGTHNCYNHTCSNTEGSFYCTCNSGYTGNGTHCEDINECTEAMDNCHNNSNCSNSEGSFSCNCTHGYIYTGNATGCRDINECTAGTHNCYDNDACSNTQGSFYCICNSGYTGNGTHCEDIDECINEPDLNCSGDAICNNTIGSYQCICKNGYLGDGIQCEDINECTATPPKCTGEDKRCVNYPGAYRCNCISPRQQLTKDGSACINVSASVRGKIQIINLPFIPAYSDTSSSEYFETTQRITSQLTRNYQETPTMRFFFHSVMMIRLLPTSVGTGVDYLATFINPITTNYELVKKEFESTFNITNTGTFLGDRGLQISTNFTIEGYNECNPVENFHRSDCGNNTRCVDTNDSYQCESDRSTGEPDKNEINGALFIAVIVPVTLCVPLACILIAIVAFRRRQKETMVTMTYGYYDVYQYEHEYEMTIINYHRTHEPDLQS